MFHAIHSISSRLCDLSNHCVKWILTNDTVYIVLFNSPRSPHSGYFLSCHIATPVTNSMLMWQIKPIALKLALLLAVHFMGIKAVIP